MTNYEYAIKVSDGTLIPLAIDNEEVAMELARQYTHNLLHGGEVVKADNIQGYSVIRREVGEWEEYNGAE